MRRTVRFQTLFIAAILAGIATGVPGQQPSPPLLSKGFWDSLGSNAGNLPAPGKTKTAGGLGGVDFTDVRPGAILVGLEVWKGEYAGDDVIRAIRPIYETATGRVTGRIYGRKAGSSTKMEAREGFAVSGIEVRVAGEVVEDIKVLFWQIHETGPSLDAEGSYKEESDAESRGGKPFRQLSANGKIVVGIFGGSAYAVDSIGLLYIDRN